MDKRLLHETAMRLAKEKVAEGLAGKDADLMQAAKALDDLYEAYNIISERLAEWYGIHYPEERLRAGELPDRILQRAPGPDDIGEVRGLASTARSIFLERKALEDYIAKAMGEVAPNLANVLGPTLGARLIARSGGLAKLARMPASSIQVIGAGEALFSHLKAGTPPPKHGLIYKHPLVSGSPRNVRGKVSRMLAGKAAIAARIDYYSGEVADLGDLKARAAAIGGRPKARRRP